MAYPFWIESQYALMMSGRGVSSWLATSLVFQMLQSTPLKGWTASRQLPRHRPRALSSYSSAGSDSASPIKVSPPSSPSVGSLATSRLGLDPAQNHFHAPIVYHENFSFADWPESHTFPVSTLGETERGIGPVETRNYSYLIYSQYNVF